MTVRFELAWRGEDGIDRRVPVGDLLTVGRGVSNDLVIPSDRVSNQHARFWVEDGALWVKDSGSTNGTFVGDERVATRTKLGVGDRVRLGQNVTLTIESGDVERSRPPEYVVEDLHSGMRYPLRGTFVIGDGESHLRVPGMKAHVLEVRGAAVVLCVDGEERDVRLGEVVEAGQLELRVLSMSRQPAVRTARPTWGPGHYHVHATLSGRTPLARVSDDTGTALEVEGETRATLIYVLAQQALRDREDGLARSEEGWMDDVDAVTAVWGRTAIGDVSNRLSVVVYRLRTDLKKAGLDPAFLERERGRIRVRAAGISLA
ncbi:MAG: FHA domain-containing protein [Alphaproteobacteria bacterium]|nr:FHA domain-containing protein [Alphaproteobacteria bacterium]